MAARKFDKELCSLISEVSGEFVFVCSNGCIEYASVYLYAVVITIVPSLVANSIYV